MDARRVASDLRIQFTKAADAANRAVMADTDDASTAAAREAEQATKAVQLDVERLQTLLQSLSDSEGSRSLDEFKSRFAEYQKLDGEILPLAVENTNLKAQRLSFGDAQKEADAFRQELEAASPPIAAKPACCIDALIAQARAAVLEIQVVEARHIAESDEAAMSRMEAQMAASEAAARKALDTLAGQLPHAAAPPLAAARTALDRFLA